MPNNWKTYKLGELGDIKGGKRLPKGEALVTSKTKHPYVRVTDMGTRTIPIEKLQYVPDYVFPKISRYIVNTDDLILSIVGTVGSVSIIDKKLDNASLTENCVKITNLKNIDKEYLYYFLTSDIGQFEISKGIVGSTQPKLPIYNINDLEISLPENLQEQQSIAAILSAIDDKIENNLAINKTLEEMAMALYKHWFVDFGPFKDGEFVESELGRIPKGWEVKTIYDVCDVVYGAAFKSKLFNENKEGFPLIRIRDLKTLKPQYYTLENHPKKTIIKAGDVVAGMDAEFDPYFWLGEDGVLNQRVVHFKPKTNFSRMFIYHSVLPWLKFYAGAKVGTTVIHLGKSDIDNFKIAVPVDFKSIKLFNEQAENYLEQIVNNSKENQTLTQLRDTLLPKLISGEVRLKEFRE